MKKIFLTFFIILCCTSVNVFSQGYNSKGGSHRGYNNPDIQQQPSAWSGSGIALEQKIFATNHHVVDGATNLYIYFPETKERFRAETMAVDFENDLAIVKVTDPSFPGFPSIEYGFKILVEDVGMGVFVLGFPLVDSMGEEIKLTTGVVSSRSGYQGNISQYQISAPVQPGNSGGPLFNDNAELIGIVSAKHTEADNVSYGVKLSYLMDLAEESGIDLNLNKQSQLASLSLSEKCKFVIPCTVMVLADNQRTEKQAPSPSSKYNTEPSQEPDYPKQNKPSESYPFESDVYPIRINMPQISRAESDILGIIGVEITESYTALYMTITNPYSQDMYYMIDKGAYISDSETGQRYKLTNLYNCTVAPQQTLIRGSRNAHFILYFEPIPATTSSIDFREPGESNWQIYGIQL